MSALDNVYSDVMETKVGTHFYFPLREHHRAAYITANLLVFILP